MQLGTSTVCLGGKARVPEARLRMPCDLFGSWATGMGASARPGKRVLASKCAADAPTARAQCNILKASKPARKPPGCLADLEATQAPPSGAGPGASCRARFVCKALSRPRAICPVRHHPSITPSSCFPARARGSGVPSGVVESLRPRIGARGQPPS